MRRQVFFKHCALTEKQKEMPEINEPDHRPAEALEDLLQHAKIWRANETAVSPTITTGLPLLDGFLPGHGWPRTALTEVLTTSEGVGALSLVLPAVARLTEKQWAIWICPPHVPYAPALQAAGVVLERLLIIEPDEATTADTEYRLWVFEQALRFADCGVAMVWLEAAEHMRLRRLQLACEQGQTWGVMFRPGAFAAQASPAALRVSLSANPDGGHDLRLLKSQGGSRARSCRLEL